MNSICHYAYNMALRLIYIHSDIKYIYILQNSIDSRNT
jgi:hypothetical protein